MVISGHPDAYDATITLIDKYHSLMSFEVYLTKRGEPNHCYWPRAILFEYLTLEGFKGHVRIGFTNNHRSSVVIRHIPFTSKFYIRGEVYCNTPDDKVALDHFYAVFDMGKLSEFIFELNSSGSSIGITSRFVTRTKILLLRNSRCKRHCTQSSHNLQYAS